MIDSVRGVLRVRKWPRKYGKARSALQQYWIDWFRQANLLAKYADGMTQARAIALTKGTGLYPRDIMLKAMRGRLYVWADTTGWKWYPMAAIQDVSDSLDALAQTIGSVLVRATDRWRAAGPASPTIGDALTYQGAGAPPAWASAGAGVSQQTVAGTPIVPDGTKNFYDIDVTSYAEVEFTLDGIGLAASDNPRMRLSIDGAVTFKSGASDYWNLFLTRGADSSSAGNLWGIGAANSAANHNAICSVTNLRTGRATQRCFSGSATLVSAQRGGFFTFDSPVTHVRIYSNSGNNFNAGTIRAVGLLAA